nr:hypothetical protein OG461_35185 [Streptomyces sp. NBC_00995]
MDAGVAAVVGAAIGGGLAGLTATGTSWFNLRVARLQHKAQETEAARQRRFESLRERREPRSQAYADLVDVVQELLDLFRAVSQEEAHARIDELNDSARKRRAVVALAGPENVARAAAELSRTVATLRNRVLHQDSQARRTVLAVQDSLEAFTDVARAALEDDGTGHPLA